MHPDTKFAKVLKRINTINLNPYKIDGTYNKDTYQDFVDFLQEVVDADSYTVVLAKNN